MKNDDLILKKHLDIIFPNDKKIYTGSQCVGEFPSATHLIENYSDNELYNFCVALNKMKKPVIEPAGTTKETCKLSKTFNTLLINAGINLESARDYKKNILHELDRFEIIKRTEYTDGTFEFEIGKYGKKIASISFEESKEFYCKLTDIRREYINNRFSKNLLWKEWLNTVYDFAIMYGTLYPFDIWILAHTIGNNSNFSIDEATIICKHFRKKFKLTRGWNNEILSEVQNWLIEEYGVKSDTKTQSVDIVNLYNKIAIFAKYLKYTGYFQLFRPVKAKNVGWALTLLDSERPPKPIRRNKTNENGYNQSIVSKQKQKGIEFNLHHIIAHARGCWYNGFNNDIENELNLLRISVRDHNFFENNPNTPFTILDVIDGKVCIISEKNKSDIYFFKDQKHFNIDVIYNKFKPYNRELIKKLKKK
jgi:hypothetical protein